MKITVFTMTIIFGFIVSYDNLNWVVHDLVISIISCQSLHLMLLYLNLNNLQLQVSLFQKLNVEVLKLSVSDGINDSYQSK